MNNENQVQFNEDKQDKTAIIAMGGGYRATYYAGVLRALNELKINNFDLYSGVSSGIPTMAYFLTGQQKEMEDIWLHYIPGKKVYNPVNIINKKPILDLDYLVDEIFKKICPLNIAKIKKNKNKLLIPVLNYDTGKMEYKTEGEDNFFTLLKASMAIPWMNKKLYALNGSIYIDPGLEYKNPIQKIIDDGYRKILLLISRNKNFLEWQKEILLLIKNKIGKKWQKKDLKIVTIYPKEDIIPRFKNSVKKIKKNIESGYNGIMKNDSLIEELKNFKR